MNNILVPIDFSESSKVAIQTATYFARETGTEIHILHITQPVPVLKEKQRSEKAKGPEEGLWEYISEIKEVSIKKFLTEGVPYDEIVSHSEDYLSDLIILCLDCPGTKKETFSTAEILRTSRLSNCPVLLVPHKSKDFKISKITFACDFTYSFDYEESVREAFNELLDLTQDFQPEIDLLYIEVEKDEEEKATKCMRKFKNSISGNRRFRTFSQKSKTVEDGALEFAHQNNSDIICIMGHGSGSYYTQLRISITEKLMEKSDIPLLIIKSQEKL